MTPCTPALPLRWRRRPLSRLTHRADGTSRPGRPTEPPRPRAAPHRRPDKPGPGVPGRRLPRTPIPGCGCSGGLRSGRPRIPRPWMVAPLDALRAALAWLRPPGRRWSRLCRARPGADRARAPVDPVVRLARRGLGLGQAWGPWTWLPADACAPGLRPCAPWAAGEPVVPRSPGGRSRPGRRSIPVVRLARRGSAARSAPGSWPWMPVAPSMPCAPPWHLRPGLPRAPVAPPGPASPWAPTALRGPYWPIGPWAPGDLDARHACAPVTPCGPCVRWAIQPLKRRADPGCPARRWRLAYREAPAAPAARAALVGPALLASPRPGQSRSVPVTLAARASRTLALRLP